MVAAAVGHPVRAVQSKTPWPLRLALPVTRKAVTAPVDSSSEFVHVGERYMHASRMEKARDERVKYKAGRLEYSVYSSNTAF